MDHLLYSVAQAAKLIHISPNTLRAYINRGLITVVRTGAKRGTWIRSTDLEKFVEYLNSEHSRANCA